MLGKNRNSVPVNMQFGKCPIVIFHTASTQMEWESRLEEEGDEGGSL
jgi:hypothetical protein